jgi:hypothetical protein
VANERYDLVTSPAVIDELERGEYPSRDDCLKLVERLELLEITPAVLDVVERTSRDTSCRHEPRWVTA